MNKNTFIYAGVTLAAILFAVFIAKGFSPEDIDPDLDERMITDTEDLVPSGEEGSPTTFRGSCNLIDIGSTCIEYFGHYWTEETIAMACTDGEYSNERCPIPNMGGCRIMPGSETDMITWHYNIGGDPFSEENTVYANQACNAVPGGIWVEED
jgi:hypothetical protein